MFEGFTLTATTTITGFQRWQSSDWLNRGVIFSSEDSVFRFNGTSVSVPEPAPLALPRLGLIAGQHDAERESENKIRIKKPAVAGFFLRGNAPCCAAVTKICATIEIGAL